MGILKIKETNSVRSVCSFSDQDGLTAKTTGREGFSHTAQMTDAHTFGPFLSLAYLERVSSRGCRLEYHLCLSLLPVARPRFLYLCN